MTPALAVDHAYCINLDRRDDRWRKMERQFSEQGLDVERFAALEGTAEDFSAVNHRPGQIGCLKSHAAVLKDAIKRGFHTVLVMEDDLVFCQQFAQRFNDRMAELPGEWDTFYFTGTIFNEDDAPTPVSKHIYRNIRTYGLMGLVLKETVFREAISLYDQRIWNADNCHADVLQKHRRSYICQPFLAHTTLDKSDIAHEGETSPYIYDLVKRRFED